MKPRAFVDMRPSMLKNPLLSRHKVGRAPPSTHDLPPEDFRYGIRSKFGDGVREMFQNWEKVENPVTQNQKTSRRSTDFRPSNDYIATNRAAIRHGCRTAKEFREFQQNHPILKKPENSDGAMESKGEFHTRVINMVHGIPTPVTSEMKECLTWKFGRDAKEAALARQTMQASLRSTMTSSSRRTTMARASRPTRASVGHTKVAYKPPRESDTFKMKQFTDIDHYAIVDYWD